MKCPVDGTDLGKAWLGGVAVAVCRKCGGAFLKYSSLDDIIRDSVSSVDMAEDGDMVHSRENGRQLHRRCPGCGREMTTTRFLEGSDIYIDRCQWCNGVWADHGELQAAALFARERQRSAVDAQATLEENMRAMGVEIARAVRERQRLQDLADLALHLKGRVSVLTLIMPKIVLPLRSNESYGGVPPVVSGLVLLNVITLILQWVFVEDMSSFFRTFGLVPARLPDAMGIFTLFSSIFIHAGWCHLAGNMLYLWVFGAAVEGTLGSRRFVLWYLVSGVVASLLYALMNLQVGIPMVGASGAISGVLGMYIVLHPYSDIETLLIDRIVAVPAWLYLAVWVGYQMTMSMVMAATGACCGVAWSAHMGGFFSGAAIALTARRKGL